MYHFIGRDVIALRSMRAVHLLQCPQMLKLLCARVKLPAVCVTYAYLNIYMTSSIELMTSSRYLMAFATFVCALFEKSSH